MINGRSLLLRLAKAAGIAAALVLIAAALGTWALKRYLPPERLRQIVLAEAKKILHREVSTGRISIGVVHGLVVEDIAISEYPDFKAGRFAEAGSFALRLRLMPLLRRQVELDKVAVDGLKLSVVRRADGSFNFSDLSGSTAAARTPAAPPEKSLSLSISKASLRNAQLSYRDLKTGDAWKVGVPSAKVSDFRMDGPFSSDFQLTAQGRLAGKPVNVAVSFSGKADIGIVGAPGSHLLYKKGKIARRIDDKDVMSTLLQEIDSLVLERKGQ